MAKVKGLKSLIYGKFDSEAAFARELGWNRQRLNKITTGMKEPDINEAYEIACKLDQSVDTIAKIFCDKSHQ